MDQPISQSVAGKTLSFNFQHICFNQITNGDRSGTGSFLLWSGPIMALYLSGEWRNFPHTAVKLTPQAIYLHSVSDSAGFVVILLYLGLMPFAVVVWEKGSLDIPDWTRTNPGWPQPYVSSPVLVSWSHTLQVRDTMSSFKDVSMSI